MMGGSAFIHARVDTEQRFHQGACPLLLWYQVTVPGMVAASLNLHVNSSCKLKPWLLISPPQEQSNSETVIRRYSNINQCISSHAISELDLAGTDTLTDRTWMISSVVGLNSVHSCRLGYHKQDISSIAAIHHTHRAHSQRLVGLPSHSCASSHSPPPAAEVTSTAAPGQLHTFPPCNGFYGAAPAQLAGE